MLLLYIFVIIGGLFMIFSLGYCMFLDFILEKRRKKSPYYYDKDSGMLRKKDEEVFNDDRPLYCASPLLLMEEIIKIENDSNNWPQLGTFTSVEVLFFVASYLNLC